MTTKSKTFYVSANAYELIKKGTCFNTEKTMGNPHEITISWKEPKKVAISEDEWDRLCYLNGDDMRKAKQSLFGGE